MRNDASDIVILAGAGISIEEPSGIPAASGLLEVLLRWVAPNAKTRANLARRLTPGHQFNPYHFLRFEGFIQAICEVDPNIFQYLEATQTFGDPNVNHRLLASMALNGSTVLTTNFDTRIEQAAGSERLSTFVLSSRRRKPTPTDALIKVHGSFPWTRGRNVTPRATLTQIGKLGLGFERYPEFQNWFRMVTTDKHLIVIGYSASDSFDVVPLIENFSNAKTITWFSYSAGRRTLLKQAVLPRHHLTPFPSRSNTDFAAHTLGFLAARLRHHSKIYRVYGESIQMLLRDVDRKALNDATPVKRHLAGPSNLRALRTVLSENPLSLRERRSVFRILDDGVFGESYATDIEATPVRHGDQVTFVDSAVKFSRGTPESRADRAFRKGDEDSAFRILEESARESTDSGQILLLLHHFEFRFGEQQADLRRLDRAVTKTERVGQRSGILWGLIMAEWMKSFRLERESQMRSGPIQKYEELSYKILAAADRAVYYGVRAGWQPWFSTAARLAAKHSISLGAFDKGENYLKGLLTWLDRETRDGIEETAGTACALNTLGIRTGRKDLIKKANLILSKLDADMCPVVKLLRLAARAEIAHTRRRWNQFTKLEKSVNELILELDPFDHWNVRGVFSYLRHHSPDTGS